jgi:hypothetical protein
MSISNQTLETEAHRILKKLKVKIKDRRDSIAFYLTLPIEDRDDLLESLDVNLMTYLNHKKIQLPSEFEEQCAFVSWIRTGHPLIEVVSIRNHGTRTPKEKVDQIREGLRKGAADLFIPALSLWMEFKKKKGGVLSKDQLSFKNYIENHTNQEWCLAEGCDNAIKIIEEKLNG